MRPEVQASGLTRQRDWWVSLGMSVSAVSAAVSSFSGLRSLAEMAGWAAPMASLLPLTVDAYAMTATRVWLSGSTASVRARRFAKWNAIGAILLSLAGNAAYHLIAAHLLAVSWMIVLAVGAVPPVVLGLVSHLAVLRTQADAPEPRTEPRAVDVVPTTAVESAVRTPYPTVDKLVEAAFAADAAWRAAHDGRPINRDELRKALRVSGARASAALRAIREGRGAMGEQSAAT